MRFSPAFVLLASLPLTVPGHAVSAPSLSIEREIELPSSMRLASDVRWGGDHEVVVADVWTGAVALDLGTPQLGVSRLLTAGKSGGDGPWAVSHLGLSPDHLLAASAYFEIRWLPRSGGAVDGRHVYREYLWDVDLAGDRVVLLGVDRGDDSALAPDGAVAWLGSLGNRLEDLAPIHFSTAGEGAATMTNCSSFGLGAARFLPGGDVVIVPGSEPGVFLYDREGELLHVWDSIGLGADLVCDVPAEDVERFARVPEPRWKWMHQRSMIDEVIVIGEDPALVLRHPEPAGTRWELVVLGRDGSIARRDLPFATPSTLSHVAADVRDGRVVFLLSEEGRPQNAPEAKPRLVIARWQSSVGDSVPAATGATGAER